MQPLRPGCLTRLTRRFTELRIKGAIVCECLPQKRRCLSPHETFIVDCAGLIWRVQVKSAHSSSINGYAFHACGNVRSRRYTAKDIDFIIGYVVPDNVWYIIPIAEFADKTTVKVFPSSRRRMSRFEIYRDAWDYRREPVT
jgi:PD-(D/E)XK endonuclease